MSIRTSGVSFYELRLAALESRLASGIWSRGAQTLNRDASNNGLTTIACTSTIMDLTLGGATVYSAAAGCPLPHIAPGVTGQVLLLVNRSAFTLQLNAVSGNGVRLSGNTNQSLTQWDTMLLTYDAAVGKWEQVAPVMALA